ncbi:ABC transporter permease [Chengkuizengella axinellae]|uniref:ABC transporter permease n=1 Tax=Chengkuizengella axinellae TaxID=3064388 RepID=A0ABT9J085_9BACL|nr:ABC transporter permease [Chengkuizengella sp. 2205SS18-9]MDP5275026.1 ABC transporter permease [Chengkuizengella sp. 2205SS18-9]
MAILTMIIRKMIKNKWLEISLLLGLILSVALTSSIPIYTNAILHRMLVKDLQNYQLENEVFPGRFNVESITRSVMPPEDRVKYLSDVDSYMEEEFTELISLPVISYVKQRETLTYSFIPLEELNYYNQTADEEKGEGIPKRSKKINVMGLSELNDHIKIIEGRLPSEQIENDIYEVLVTEKSLSSLNISLDKEIVILDGSQELITVKPVGIFEPKDYSDLYFNNNLFNTTFYLDFNLFEQQFTVQNVLPVRNSSWTLAFDYQKIKLLSVQNLVDANTSLKRYLDAYTNSDKNIKSNEVEFPIISILESYDLKQDKLKTMISFLYIPVLIMIAFYIFLVSNLIIERQKTEISVLRSRGANRLQILGGYLIEGLILGSLAYFSGIYIAKFFTKVLGSSNGFLQFVQRTSLQVDITGEAYVYAGFAVAGTIIMMLVPAFVHTRQNIVSLKRSMSRSKKSSFLHKFYFDIIFIAVGLYGLYTFKNQINDVIASGVFTSELSIDPLLFIVPNLFIIGMGLFLLRIYPWMIQLIYWLGRKRWSPVSYSTLLQVGRSATQYQLLMIFIILTLSTGMFSASAARTINSNMIDKISYTTGADVTMSVEFGNDNPDQYLPGASEQALDNTYTQYVEPSIETYKNLPGVEHVTRVFKENNVNFTNNKVNTKVQLMGIDTADFGRVAWFKNGLMDYHFYDYLNLISTNPQAILISQSIADAHDIKVGDTVNMGWVGTDNVEFMVYGIIDYWPSWNPNALSLEEIAESLDIPVATLEANPNLIASQTPQLVVGHLDFIQSRLGLRPYDFWAKLQPDFTNTAELYNGILEERIWLKEFTNAKEQIIKVKNDPFQLAINGVMTLGFIISILISLCGFLLYWILTLKGRTLQLGMLRAMGLRFSELIKMLILEQVLTTGAAMIMGIATGILTSKLFVTLFQITFNPIEQVPPFQVVIDPSDQRQIYMIVSFIILIGIMILGYMLSRIKIHQALKLGED